MELCIEILTGKRQGHEIVLSQATELQSIRDTPYVLETEAFTLHLRLEHEYSKVNLVMDGIDSYDFSNNGIKENCFYYTLRPKKTVSNGYEALFYNYFGMASLEVKLTFDNKVDIVLFSPLEVLARKLTADQATYMVDYILEESKGDLYSCFSATRLNSGYVDGGEQPKKIFNKLSKTISVLEELLPYIITKPLTRVSSETRMQNGYQAVEIDESSLGWLSENLSVLDETDDLDRAHLHYDGAYYLAREIQTAVILDHTDIYENRIIYSFLLKLKRFSIEMERNLSETVPRKSPDSRGQDGYVSFFSAMNEWVSSSYGVDIERVNSFNDRITRLMQLFSDRVPVSIVDEGLPVLTQKAKANRFYASIFRAIVEWYRFNQVDWRSKEILLAIKSIPILFEYYTVLKTRSALKSLCDVNSVQVDKQTILSCQYGGHSVKLWYEPDFWMVGHKKVEDAQYLNTEVKRFYRTDGGEGFKASNHQFSKRVPDIVIELTSAAGKKSLLIFDAKYSTMEMAYTNYLRDCAMKYIHGIHEINGASPVRSMILICPAQNKVSLADMHAPPYNLFGDKTALPVIGVQSVGLGSIHELQMDSTLADAIERLLILTIKVPGLINEP